MFHVTINYMDGTTEKLDTTEEYAMHLLAKGLGFVESVSLARYA